MTVDSDTAENVKQYLEAWVTMRTMMNKQENRKPNPDLYLCYEQLVLDRGRPFTRKPLDQLNLDDTVTLFDFSPYEEQGNCFANAWMLHTDLREFGVETAYVEGYAAGLLPTNHAWVLDLSDGLIVDTTWEDDDEHTAYFGIVFSDELALSQMVRTNHYGLLGNDWMLDCPLLRRDTWT